MDLDRLARRYSSRPCVVAGYGGDHPLSQSLDRAAAEVGLEAEQRLVRRNGEGIQPVYVMGSI